MKTYIYNTKKEYYLDQEKCPNCGHNNHLQIPKGTTISKFLQRVKCTVCNCNMGQLLKNLWS